MVLSHLYKVTISLVFSIYYANISRFFSFIILKIIFQFVQADRSGENVTMIKSNVRKNEV